MRVKAERDVEEDFNKLPTKEQLEMLTKLAASKENNPDIDFWSLPGDLLGQSFHVALRACQGFDP